MVDVSRYFNTGMSGLCTETTYQAMIRYLQEESELQKASMDALVMMHKVLATCRCASAQYIGARPENIALLANTTDAIGRVLATLDLRPGDTAGFLSVDHAAVALPLTHLGARLGVRAVEIEVGCLEEPEEALLDFLRSERPALLCFSHVAYLTGEIMDMTRVCRETRTTRCLTVVDGAQAVGQLPVDVESLGVDCYAFPAHKWVGGPEGVGGAIRKPALEPFGPSSDRQIVARGQL